MGRMLTDAERAALLAKEGEIDAALLPTCPFCEEPVPQEQADPHHAQPAHGECVFRAVVGSVAHLQRRCSCYAIGATCGDPDGMTKREAARAAVALYHALTTLGVDVFAERRRQL